MIPKLAFTYWEGKQFSPLHLLTIHTLSFYNPDISIIIYYSDDHDINPCWDGCEQKEPILVISDINTLKSIHNVSFQKIDFQSLFNYNITSSVYKADIVRIYKLHEHGGIWFDFDIFFINKIPDIIFNQENELGLFTYYNTHATGFVIGKQNNQICKKMLDTILYKFTNNIIDRDYAQFGPSLWDKTFSTYPDLYSKCIMYPNTLIYPYLYTDLNTLYYTSNNLLTECTFGIHWYNGSGHSKTFINTYFKDKNLISNTVFTNLIEEFINLSNITI